MKIRLLVVVLGLIGLSVAVVQAGDMLVSAEKDAVDGSAVKAKLAKSLPAGVEIEAIESSPIPGLYQAKIGGGWVFVSEDGQHIISGDLYKASAKGMENLSEVKREEEKVAFRPKRQELIGAVKTEDMVVFAPEGETKVVVNVFTDVDCGYCRKFHQQVSELNAKGVEVRYLAFPRAGIERYGQLTSSYKKIASAWCADDQKAALTKLKNLEKIPEKVCANNPVEAQLELGKKLGVRGTPAMVLESGELVPGYLPVPELTRLLGISS